MPSVLNQYSLLLLIAVLLAVVAFFLFRKGLRLAEILAFSVIMAGLVAAWFMLRPTQTTLTGAAAEVEKRIGAGEPVLLEFQSPY